MKDTVNDLYQDHVSEKLRRQARRFSKRRDGSKRGKRTMRSVRRLERKELEWLMM